MSLSHYQHSQRRRIEASLRRSDPKLASMLGMFGPARASACPPGSKRPPARPDPAGGCLAREDGYRHSCRHPPPARRGGQQAGRALAAPVVPGGRARPWAPETGRRRRSQETGGRPDLAGWG